MAGSENCVFVFSFQFGKGFVLGVGIYVTGFILMEQKWSIENDLRALP